MDRPKPGKPFPVYRRLALATIVIALVCAAVFVDFRWLRPALRFDRDDFVTAPVMRGRFTVTVQGSGRLRPITERWITAEASGTVDQVFVQFGQSVEPGGKLAVLSNPHAYKAVERAELALAEAQAQHQGLLADFTDRRLAGEARVVDYNAAYEQIQLRLEAEAKLLVKKAISKVDYQKTEIQVDRARTNLDIERKRLAELEDSLAAGRQASEARLATKEIELRLARDEVDALILKAPVQGVVRTILVDPGQQILAGEKVAQIADIHALMGEVRIPESQARHVAATQPALAAVLNAEIRSVVARVDPAVTGGSVAVDIQFVDALPDGVRPDLSIGAAITVAELEDVLYVRRPLHVGDNSSADVFRLAEDGGSATRSTARFGLGTFREIQVLDGLSQGDVLILGDIPESVGDRLQFK